MVNFNFPAALTEEEEALKQALVKLKKKKKTLQSLKAAAQNQEKDTSHNKNTGKQAPRPVVGSSVKATEIAKKLVQSGAIKVAELKEKSGFKRSKNFEKKMKDTEKTTATPVGFQPFHASFSGGEDDDEKPPTSKRMKGLSETFVSAGFKGSNNRDRDDNLKDQEYSDRRRDRESTESRRDYDGDNDNRRGRGFGDSRRDRDYHERPEREWKEPPKKGNTIYVNGLGITEEMLKKFFARFGKIVNMFMETDRNNAFITFEKMESADQAISEANEALVNHVKLRVQMARRQRPVDTLSDSGSSTSSWSTIAANSSQKGAAQKGSRNLVTYDATDIF